MQKISKTLQSEESSNQKAADQVPDDWRNRELLTVNHAKLILSCGRTRLYELINNGQVTRFKNGKSTRITVESVLRFVSISEGKPAQQ